MKCEVCGRFTGIRAGAVVLLAKPIVHGDAPDEHVLCARCFDLNGAGD